MNDILKRNEEISRNRDDAKALAKGMQVLIDANTLNGKVDEVQLAKDMRYFMIDMGASTSHSFMVSLVTDFEPSNAAFNLYGGPRLGTVGWNDRFVDLADPGSNQAHHFAASFVEGLQLQPIDAKTRAVLLEMNLKGNVNDIHLSHFAIDLVEKVRQGKLSWKDLPNRLYQEIKAD